MHDFEKKALVFCVADSIKYLASLFIDDNLLCDTFNDNGSLALSGFTCMLKKKYQNCSPVSHVWEKDFHETHFDTLQHLLVVSEAL